MRDPASPSDANAPENVVSSEPVPETARIAAVSLPDRRRIDSDVRAFLREPSTPWIVFDQEGRPPSQLAVGEVLTVPRKTLLSDYDFFPATAAADASASAARLEPSSLALAADLEGDDDLDAEARLADALPLGGLRRRALGAAAAGVALMAILAVGAFALRGSSPDTASARSSLSAPAAQTPRSFGGSVPAEVPPPELAPVAASVPAAAQVTVATPAAITPPRDEAMSKPASKRWGRLSVAGDARGKDVFMDGKRMLGRGARSFTVMCGTHSIAIGSRADAHDVEIPCNAELVVGK
jgi:hypothetical protein